MLLDLTECVVFQTFTSVNNFAIPGIRTTERPLRSLPEQPHPSPSPARPLSVSLQNLKRAEKSFLNTEVKE